jgi:proteasome accessory factor B
VIKQTSAERLFTLTCCLVAAPRIGVSKQQLLLSVPGYQEGDSQEALDKMFERDKKALRKAGVALEVLDGEGSDNPDDTKYRIVSGSFDWPKDLELNTQKLQLLELAGKAWQHQAMRASARAAITRLKALGYVQKTQDLEIFSPRILAKHASFSPLAEAISDGFRVSFDYQKPGAESSSRELTPLKLRYLEGQWVLLAAEGDEVKNFLLRRITSKVKILPFGAASISSSAISEAEQSLVEFVAGQQVTLELEADSEAWWHFGAPQDHKVSFNYMDKELLVEDLLELAIGLRVLEPVEVREMLTKRLETVAVRHA